LNVAASFQLASVGPCGLFDENLQLRWQLEMDRESYRRRDLPHWDVPGATYFVTTCLAGSIPARGLLDIERYNAELGAKPRPGDCSESDWSLRKWKLAFARTDRWLDTEPANRALADPQLARIVADAFLFFAGVRYDLLAYVVMPSHIHWVFRPLDSWVATLRNSSRSPRESIVHSINRYTSLQCNSLRNRTGEFWQHESYDHWIRDVDELERVLHYVEGIPSKPGS
jgi:REP element-mobilizing transposase RayT